MIVYKNTKNLGLSIFFWKTLFETSFWVWFHKRVSMLRACHTVWHLSVSKCRKNIRILILRYLTLNREDHPDLTEFRGCGCRLWWEYVFILLSISTEINRSRVTGYIYDELSAIWVRHSIITIRTTMPILSTTLQSKIQLSSEFRGCDPLQAQETWCKWSILRSTPYLVSCQAKRPKSCTKFAHTI